MKNIKKAKLLMLLAAGLAAEVCAAPGDDRTLEESKSHEEAAPAGAQRETNLATPAPVVEQIDTTTNNARVPGAEMSEDEYELTSLRLPCEVEELRKLQRDARANDAPAGAQREINLANDAHEVLRSAFEDAAEEERLWQEQANANLANNARVVEQIDTTTNNAHAGEQIDTRTTPALAAEGHQNLTACGRILPKILPKLYAGMGIAAFLNVDDVCSLVAGAAQMGTRVGGDPFNVRPDISVSLSRYQMEAMNGKIWQSISERNNENILGDRQVYNPVHSITILPGEDVTVATMLQVSQDFVQQRNRLPGLTRIPELIFKINKEGVERLEREYVALRQNEREKFDAIRDNVNLKIDTVFSADLKYPFMIQARGVRVIRCKEVNDSVATLLNNNKNTIRSVSLLSLLGCTFTQHNSFFNALAQLTNLTDLDLRHSHISNDRARALAYALTQLPNLTDLDLSENTIGDAGANALARAFPQLTNLTRLRLDRNIIGDAGVNALVPALAELRNLRSLCLSGRGIGDAGANALARALPSLTNLTDLSLKDAGINEAGVIALVPALAELRNLRSLNLDGIDMGNAGAHDLARALPSLKNLEHLNLKDTRIYGASATVLVPALAELRNLKSLNLDGIDMGNAGAHALARALPSLNNLEHLNLNNTGINGAGVNALVPALAELRNLKSLKLDGSFMGDEGFTALSRVLQNNQTLEHLSLDNTGINEDGVNAVAKALAQLKHLKSLSLNGNRIGNRGTEQLANILSNKTHLEHLGLDGSGIDEDGVNALVPAVLNKTTLKSLHLRGNTMSEERKEILRQAVRGRAFQLGL